MSTSLAQHARRSQIAREAAQAGAAAGDYDEWAIKSISSRSPLADRLAWLAIYSWGCPRKSREP